MDRGEIQRLLERYQPKEDETDNAAGMHKPYRCISCNHMLEVDDVSRAVSPTPWKFNGDIDSSSLSGSLNSTDHLGGVSHGRPVVIHTPNARRPLGSGPLGSGRVAHTRKVLAASAQRTYQHMARDVHAQHDEAVQFGALCHHSRPSSSPQPQPLYNSQRHRRSPELTTTAAAAAAAAVTTLGPPPLHETLYSSITPSPNTRSTDSWMTAQGQGQGQGQGRTARPQTTGTISRRRMPKLRGVGTSGQR